jgi:hypothetical protein
MGCLISIEEEIEAIRFVDFPTRPKKVEKVVRIDRTVMARIDATTVATNRVNKNFAYMPGNSMDDVVHGLFSLGMISKAAMDSHISYARECQKVSDEKFAATNLRKSAKLLGISLTNAQIAKIEKAES